MRCLRHTNHRPRSEANRGASLSGVPRSYFHPRNRTKLRWFLLNLCTQCGKVETRKFRWCVKCRRRLNR